MKGRIPNIPWLAFALCVVHTAPTVAQEANTIVVEQAAPALSKSATQSVGECSFRGTADPDGLLDAVSQCRGAQIFAARVRADGELQDVMVRSGTTIVSGEAMSLWASEWVVSRPVLHAADVALFAEVARFNLDDGTVVLERVGARVVGM